MTGRLASPTTTFTFPDDRIATEPPERRGLTRDRVRLLIGSSTGISHTLFRHLGSHLCAGDLLVVNNSAAVIAELDGSSGAHGPLVLHLASRLEDLSFVVELRSVPDAATPLLDARPGEIVNLARGVTIRLLTPYPYAGSAPQHCGQRLPHSGQWQPHSGQRQPHSGQPQAHSGQRLWRAATSDPAALAGLLTSVGRPISYGYLSGRFGLSAYQTVFATVPGSAEMPSAGRPFSDRLVTELVSSGIGIAPVTLHTGVSSQEAGEGPQAEWFEVPAATAALVNLTKERGGRVIAVGTTVTRALESAVRPDAAASARTGWTEHVVTPDNPPRLVDGLITGWHNPDASHLLLVEAIAGPELSQAAYDAAVAQGYLWHEFGDSALLLPRAR